MIAVVPLTSSGLGLDEATAGMWAGASTHEVAQVVAIGGIIGPAALEVAVLVKLARVIMLAPTVAILELVMRRSEARVRTASAEAGDESAVPAPAGQRPPIVPLFVIGFLLMAGLRTFGLLPEMAVTGLGIVQTVCLSMAMFALGRGVQWRALRSLGGGPIALATMTTIVVALVALGGALLLT